MKKVIAHIFTLRYDCQPKSKDIDTTHKLIEHNLYHCVLQYIVIFCFKGSPLVTKYNQETIIWVIEVGFGYSGAFPTSLPIVGFELKRLF